MWLRDQDAFAKYDCRYIQPDIKNIEVDMKREKVLLAKERGYTVTNDGICLNKNGKPVGCLGSQGYTMIGLIKNKKYYRIEVHKIQAYQKYGEKIFEDGIMCRHKNGIKTDNSYDNILIGTHTDNMRDIPQELRRSRALYAASFIKRNRH